MFSRQKPEEAMVERGLMIAGTTVSDRKAAKKARRAGAKAATREAKLAKARAQADAKATPTRKEPRITPKKAKNAVAVAKVLAPVVIPLVAPYAVRAFGAAREALDRRQARKLGVSVDSLGEYTGHGAALHARISGAYDSLAELRDSGRLDDVTLAENIARTLHDLTLAVRLAERMPAARRKQAHRAVADELEQLEAQLLKRLGVA